MMRVDRPFIKVNCAALPEDLLESELFGYEKGAFTGANCRKPGRFEVADKGTIFLDEISEMSPALQAKMLQVLQDRVFTRLGGHSEIRVDVQIVSTTNRPLIGMVAQNQFREDLYFRLNVVNVSVPPLRDRLEEIPDLVGAFLRRSSIQYGKVQPELSAELLRAFHRYPFPGNVRELENMIKRIVVLESEDSILEEIARREAGEERGRTGLQTLLEEIEQTAGEVNSWYHAGNPTRNHELAVLVADPQLRAARLVLAHAVRVVLRNGLRILNVSAPVRMERALEELAAPPTAP